MGGRWIREEPRPARAASSAGGSIETTGVRISKNSEGAGTAEMQKMPQQVPRCLASPSSCDAGAADD